jgi:hypothetical protein
VGEWVGGTCFSGGGWGGSKGSAYRLPWIGLFIFHKSYGNKGKTYKTIRKTYKTYKNLFKTYKTIGKTYKPIQGTLWALP